MIHRIHIELPEEDMSTLEEKIIAAEAKVTQGEAEVTQAMATLAKATCETMESDGQPAIEYLTSLTNYVTALTNSLVESQMLLRLLMQEKARSGSLSGVRSTAVTAIEEAQTQRQLNSCWLLCVEDDDTKLLSAVGSSFAVRCANNRKIITAFQSIAFPEPEHHTANLTGPYYVVRRLDPKQQVDERAIPVVYKGVGDHKRDWAILEVADSSTHVFVETLPLRSTDRPLPSPLQQSTRLRTIYYKYIVCRVVRVDITGTDFDRVDHVYSETVEMDGGLSIAARGAPMIDIDGCVACIHRKTISEVPPIQRIRMAGSNTVIEVHPNNNVPQSRFGSIIFNIPALINDLC